MRAIIFKYRCYLGGHKTLVCASISPAATNTSFITLCSRLNIFTCKAFLHAINNYQQKNTLKDANQFLSNSFRYFTYKLHNCNTLVVLLSSKMCNENESHIFCTKVFLTFGKIAQ